MSVTNVGKRLRRYRAENPYSHTLSFFFLDAFLGLSKIVLVGVVLIAAWLAGSAWMNAQQHSPQAIAIVAEEIKQQPVTAAHTVVRTEAENPDAVLDVTVSVQENTRPDNNDAPIVAVLGDEWLLNQSRDSFTLQVGSSPARGKLVAFANEVVNDQQTTIYAYKVSRIGNPIYGLALGLYPDLQSAQQSIEKLPASYRQFDPWVRPLGELQDQIIQVKERLAL